jgi:HAD superfamily hydrolase (TIGR01509 family)
VIRALVFDFDGLILDTETPELRVWQQIFADHGCELTVEAWADCVGRPPGSFDPCQYLVELRGREIDRETVRQAARSRSHELVSDEHVRPGVRRWLDDAATLGMRVGIASSSRRGWVEGHLERLGLMRHFEMLVCHEDVPTHKPDPAPYLLAAARLDVLPAEAIAIEDSVHGVEAAKAAGMWTVAVPNHVTRSLIGERADVTLGSLNQRSLGEIIRMLEG